MYRDLLKRITVEEKIHLCCGADFWKSVAFEHYGIPAMTVADGPHGIRFQVKGKDMLGMLGSVPATCFPTSATIACSWDRELIGQIGQAIAEEALAYGVDTVLGPGLNIKRSPLCGRNFEYFSEDPYLTGRLGSAYVKAVQAKGVGTCIKHFAGNSQEYKRFSSNDHIDERTLREIYLPAFEEVVKQSQPAMVMCAYNKINGVYCSDNKELLTGILRNEWGFSGMVVTDWGAMHDRVAGFQSGCDWSMPGGTMHQQKHALEAYKAGTLKESEIDACAERILARVFSAMETRKSRKDFDMAAHHTLAAKAAAQSAVLLKNKDSILPLKTDSVALIGHMAKHSRYQGNGSSKINPTKLTSLRDAACAWTYVEGCTADGKTTDALLEEAQRIAKSADVAVVIAGLTDSYESEGFDRDHMRMSDGHICMIEAVAAANPNTIVVLLCGSPVELPWFDHVKAVVYFGLFGQAGGEAAYDILTGKVNPGGKLAETWPFLYEDAPCSGYYGAPHRDAQYREGIYVGYRYYETADVPVRFPFGYGLSYTTFAYSNLQFQDRTITVTITNTGTVPGAEIVQLYVTPTPKGVHRPVKELKGFEKVFLEPDESKEITFNLDDRSFAIWSNGWVIPSREYEVQLGASVRDIRLACKLNVNAGTCAVPAWQSDSWYENPKGLPSKADFEKMLGHVAEEPALLKKGSFTVENTIGEMAQYSLVMRLMKHVMAKTIAKMTGGSGKVNFTDPTFRMAYASSVDSALFSLMITSGGSLSENLVLSMLDMANGHPLQGIRRMLTK